jgi:hypothetical protein
MFEYRNTRSRTTIDVYTIDELRRRQRNGIMLTKREKDRITKDAENTRKQRQSKRR